MIAIICVLLIAAVGYILYRPSWVDPTMDGVEMTADGTELYQRKITLRGWHFRPIFDEEAFKAVEIQIEGMDVSVYPNVPYPIRYDIPSAFLTHYIILDNRLNKPVGCEIMWHEDRSCCVILFDDRYFAGSVSGDYAAAL